MAVAMTTSKRAKNSGTRTGTGARASTPRLARSPVHLLHRAGQCAEVLFSKEFEALSLTPRQYAVLLASEHHEGGTQTDIVMMTGIDRSTLADLVRRLVSKGLLQRRRSRQDARAYNVRVTEEGRRLLQQTADTAARVDQRLMSSMSASDRARFLELLEQMIRKFDPATAAGAVRGD